MKKPTDKINTGAAQALTTPSGSLPVEVSVDWLTLIKEMIFDAAIDMRRTRRTNQYNLTGQDIATPEDKGDPPRPPLLIHQRGLDESETCEENLREAVSLIREKIDSANKEICK